MPSQPSNPDQELAEFFTDVEYLRDAFKKAVAAPTLTKRLLVVHGVGGVGKSSLLRMFRLHCRSVKVPVALASGDEAKSALDVLTRWTDDLKADGVAFPTFGKTFEHYREIQARVDAQAKKAGSRAADFASKTGEAAGGTLAGAAIGSIVPGIGTVIGGALGGVLGGMGAEALTDWLRGFLKQPDIDLLLDPAKKLTDDFLADLAKAVDKRRSVLLLDTFEQMTALDDWAREIAQRLHANVLFVIAGRALPNWSRAWDSWQKHAHVEELKPMTEDVMRDLVRRYYATMRGGEPAPAQVEAIICFARGLPMVVTSAVQLWVKYGVEDFQAVKAEIVANLVDRLMEGVPSALIPALEAAAIVRWFDQPILRAVMQQDDVRGVYNELRRFPFVRSRVEGLALHDAVREMMDENLRVQDSERHRALHERAAAYFETETGTSEVSQDFGSLNERLGLERLYHRVRADEDAGIQLFQEMAEELTRYRLVNRLRALLNDVNTYPLERENSRLWREYYNARLAHLQAQFSDAERSYQAIADSEQLEPKLRAYALCDLGEIWSRTERIGQLGGVQRALNVLERSQRLTPQLDSKLGFVFLHLRGVYASKGKWQKAIESIERQQQFFEQGGDKYGLVQTFSSLKDIYGVTGNWKAAQDALTKGLEILKTMPDSRFLRAGLTGDAPWSYFWSGRYFEAEQAIKSAINFGQLTGEVLSLPGRLRHLGFSLGLQGKFKEATDCFSEAVDRYTQRDARWQGDGGVAPSFWGITLAKQGVLDKAEEYLLEGLSFKRRAQDNIGIPEVADWLGELQEVKTKFAKVGSTELLAAESYYNLALDFRWTGRRNFECEAITGLVRVKHAQGDYAAIAPLLAEAEQLAQQYEYNDHLASLRLTQAQTLEVFGDLKGLTALDYFKHAMIYALRYNRFLLDEVLSGRPQGSPLRPIIPYCLECGEDGQRMLTALREWWQTGVNDLGTPRPDTISPIPEGVTLLEAERIARAREPGDGSPQKSVVTQIEGALLVDRLT